MDHVFYNYLIIILYFLQKLQILTINLMSHFQFWWSKFFFLLVIYWYFLRFTIFLKRLFYVLLSFHYIFYIIHLLNSPTSQSYDCIPLVRTPAYWVHHLWFKYQVPFQRDNQFVTGWNPCCIRRGDIVLCRHLEACCFELLKGRRRRWWVLRRSCLTA